MRRVVITGLGAVTPNGNTFETSWNSLLSFKSGISQITKFDTSDLNVKIAGEVKGFDPLDHGMDKKFIKRTDIVSQYVLAAANEALRDSRIPENYYKPQRSGCTVATGFGGIETYEKNYEAMLKIGPKKVSPFLVPKFLTNMPGGWVSVQHDLQGYISSCAAACATGTVSLIDGFRAIRENSADMIVAGAGEASVTRHVVAGFANLKALSTKNGTPESASSPFDKDRDGFILSEGAAVLVLEEMDSALNRGADIYAEITGWGITSDASHFTHPSEDGRGMVNAIDLALESSGLKPEQIQYINAHGTSTKINDAAETKAIRKVFGDFAGKLVVSSTKSMSGHMLSAAGAFEAAVVAKSIKEQVVHGTANYINFDENCDLDYCKEGSRKMTLENVLSNSFGFGGVNAVAAFTRFSV